MTNTAPHARLPRNPMTFQCLIGGRFIAADERPVITRENPATLTVVSHYPHATAEDVAEAVAVARKTFDSGV